MPDFIVMQMRKANHEKGYYLEITLNRNQINVRF